jgi:uncharacterized membrane protein
MNPGHHRWHATCRHGRGITSRRRCNAAHPTANMKYAREFIASTVVGGLFIVVPAYLAILLLLKGMKSVGSLVRPIAALVPDWLPAENLLSLLLVLGVCFLVGVAVRTPAGRAARERIERVFFDRLPGYGLLRSLTQRLAGDGDQRTWQPALVELEDALVPAFIIEEHDDSRFTVFVPSVPTPLAGAVYVMERERVHILDIPFTTAISSISRWGSGSKELVAAMRETPRRAGESSRHVPVMPPVHSSQKI